MKFNQKKKTIFLDLNSPQITINEKVNIILSPSLYWVKKLTLTVKRVGDAKKLLPSIFEDTLSTGNYNYSVYKDGEVFIAFAYDDKYILDTIESKGISSSNIANVYFAQSELQFIDGAMKVNETQSIAKKDNILILLPCCWVEEKGNLNLDEVILSKHSISLAQFGHIVDSKSLYKIAAVLLALIALVNIELFITSQKINELTSLKENLFKKEKLQTTMFQNRAMLDKYNKIHTKQSQLRSVIATILSLKLKPGESLKELSLKNKSLFVSFNLLSDMTIKTISKKLKAEKIKFKADNKGNIWQLEVLL